MAKSRFVTWKRVDRRHPPELMDYAALTVRLRKSLYYGTVAEILNSSLPLTDVVVEKFSENDSNLFLEKLCFDYAAELSHEACLSPCSLVVALIYLERLIKNNPNFVSSLPSSKLFVISVMLASKFLNDEGEEDEVINSDWANSAKMNLTELNDLEKQFLQAIEWRLYVDDEDFNGTLTQIEFRVAQRESLKRGWLTYTDLDVLSERKLLGETWDMICDMVINVSVVCVTAYVASLVTLIGSALVVSSLPWNCRNIPSHFEPLLTRSYATPSSNLSFHTHEVEPLDVKLDLDLNGFRIQDLDSDSFIKELTAVTLASFTYLSKPLYSEPSMPILGKTSENFTAPLVHLQRNYCSLLNSIAPFQQNVGSYAPFLCTINS